MDMTNKIFVALSGVSGIKRTARTIAIDVFGTRFTESQLNSLKRSLNAMVKNGRLDAQLRYETHAVRNNRFGGAATGKHKVTFYSIHVEPGISVQNVFSECVAIGPAHPDYKA